MSEFQIHPQLLKDCFHIGQLNGQALLLLDNSLVPWFIILPVTTQTELYKLEKPQRHLLEKNIDIISEFVSDHYEPDKLNVASIGNIVSQMHMHIVGRFKEDVFWPGVIWGRAETKSYRRDEVVEIVELFCERAGNQFIRVSE